MSCCRVMVHVFKQFAYALSQGFMEFCARGCILGTQYLVRPNYHRSERFLWLVIFLVTSAIGFNLLHAYMRNYSENVYRVIYEDHGLDEHFHFPSVGICELGSKETLKNVERVLNNTVFANFPTLEVDHDIFTRFLNVLAFQGLHAADRTTIRSFINYTQGLPLHSGFFFEDFLDYRGLVKMIRSSCTEFFDSCLWEDEPFNCCQHFREISTTLGTCFIFNSQQNYSEATSKLLENIQIYNEPYRMTLNFHRPAQIFLLNHKDIPETITPIQRHTIRKMNIQLSLEFTIVPTVNDRELEGLPSKITNCVSSQEKIIRDLNTYDYSSYTTCITDCFVMEQWKTCGCINLYHNKPGAPFCKLSQYACLEEHGFINPVSMVPMKYPFCRHCLINCEDGDYHVKNLYLKFKSALQGRRSLELILLNFPTKHKRRQVIRQSEDKLVSLSGILCLFLGANVVNIIEFLYLFMCALVRRRGRPANNIQMVAGYP